MNFSFKIILSSIILTLFVSSLWAKDNKISAYLVGKYISVNSAKSTLSRAGYDIVASYEPLENGTTILFTNKILKAQASKEGHAYAAILRLFIDKEEDRISITNPIYFGKAFMQDDFILDVYQNELNNIKANFHDLEDSEGELSFTTLSNYHFMMSMPYYRDMLELGEGNNGNLVEKLKSYKNSKYFVFELKLSDSSTLIGYDLERETKKFVTKIGRNNAAVLPYCISIENSKARALAPKYYLAISYPSLTMNQFTTIATVPEAIIEELSKPFQ